jgi:CRISPR-associated protein Cmr5
MPKYKKKKVNQPNQVQFVKAVHKKPEAQLNADQYRAQFALNQMTELVSGENSLTKDQQKEFKSYIQSLPAMIQINGIGQAIAFYRSRFDTQTASKEKRAYKAIYDLLQTWLIDERFAVLKDSGKSDLMEALVNSDMKQYRMAQIELLEILSWVKKFSLALIVEETSKPKEEPVAQEA